jgi:hypothetical protein
MSSRPKRWPPSFEGLLRLEELSLRTGDFRQRLLAEDQLKDPHREKPWFNFAAGSGADGFIAGRWVEGRGSDQARMVRLVFADGLKMDDTVDNGIVLFCEPRCVSFPADARILDDQEGLLARYMAFDEFPFRT